MKYDMNFLRKNPIFFSRLGFGYDPSMRGKNGKVVSFTNDPDKFGRFHKMFADAGVNLHTCILNAGWVGIDDYDYSLTDETLETLFKHDPKGLYIPRVKLNVPVDWCRQNPEDVFVYYEGIGVRDKIPEVVGTLRHDYLGYDAPDGYYMASDDAENKEIIGRPNVNSLISLQSFSSKKWLEDGAVALEKLIDHIEEKYGDRIIGYHIAYGACGESMKWGRNSCHYGDYGINNLKYFYDFALEKYKTHEEIEKAWGISGFTRDDVFLTAPEDRYFKKGSLGELFRADNQIAIDYDEFSSQVNSNALMYFCKKVKEKTGKLAGGFYGYMNYMENSNYAGHLGIDNVLSSPYVDFLAAPKSYYRCNVGDPGGFMCPIDSFNSQKVWLDELDNRTYLSNVPAWESKADTLEGTINVFFRELSKNLSHDAGFWWMDLGGGWFDSPEVMEIVKQMRVIKDTVETKEHKSRADVLVITDDSGMMKTMPSNEFIKAYCREVLCEFSLSSVLYDCYRLPDLDKIDLSQYKLIVFAYTFAVTDKTKALADKLVNEGRTVMFCHGAGIWYNNEYSIENVEKFTGFKIVADEESRNEDYPTVHVEGHSEDIVKNGNRIMCTDPKIKKEDLRKIAEDAGCFIYGREGSIYYGDSRFLGVFSGEGENTVHFPEKGTYVEMVSGDVYEDVSEVKYSADINTSKIFVKK